MKLRVDIFEENQESICNYCETHIIEGSSMSYHFQCEGRFCEEAIESWYEDDEEGIKVMRNNKLERLIEDGI